MATLTMCSTSSVLYGNGISTTSDDQPKSATELERPGNKRFQFNTTSRSTAGSTPYGVGGMSEDWTFSPIDTKCVRPRSNSTENSGSFTKKLPRQEESLELEADLAGGELVCSCRWKAHGCPWVGEVEKVEEHLNQGCGFVEVECEFNSVGCPDKFLRKDMPRHYQEGVQNHLILTTASLRRREEIEAKLEVKFSQFQEQFQDSADAIISVSRTLQERNEEMSDVLRSRDDQVEGLKQQLLVSRSEIQSIGDELQSKNEQLVSLQTRLDVQDKQLANVGIALTERGTQIERLAEKIEKLTVMIRESSKSVRLSSSRGSDSNDSTSELPFDFLMSDFTQHQRNSTPWESSPFYSHPRGYKLCARIYANHQLLGEGTHIAFFFYALRGEYDDTLVWPRKLTVTVELLNQATGEWKNRKSHTNVWQNPQFFTQGGSGWPKFVAYAELNSGKEVQYMKDECIYFRVASVRLD